MNKSEEFKKTIFKKYPDFSEKVKIGKEKGLIQDFGFEEFEKISSLSKFVINTDFKQAFYDGFNVGRCGFFAKTMSYAYDSPSIISGFLPILKNTPGSEKGEHGWFENDNYIYDTSLLLKIDKKYSNVLGYIEKGRYSYSDLMRDSVYSTRKEMYNDLVVNKRK